MGSYKDLEVYKMAHEGAIRIHKISLKLPKFEQYEEGSQIRRSSKSVSSNIVEGFSRKKYQQDYARFITVAHGSCNETIEHLQLMYDTGSLKDKKTYDLLYEYYNTLGRMLNRLAVSITS